MTILTTVKEALVGGGAEATERTTSERDRSTTAFESEADLVLATGRTRKETLLELVEAHEGRVKQAELVELTDWSKSTVSRQLSELERDGAINRVQIGRCKIVILPDESLVGDPVVSYDTP